MNEIGILSLPVDNLIVDEIDSFLTRFDILFKKEDWKQIMLQGSIALQDAKFLKKDREGLIICLQLIITAFHRGDYNPNSRDYKQALGYVTRCHEFAEKCDNPYFDIRSFFLKSDSFCILVAKEKEQQDSYRFPTEQLGNINLKNTISLILEMLLPIFPKEVHCHYSIIKDFMNTNATDDVIYIMIHLGEVCLLQDNLPLCQQMIQEVRSQILSLQSILPGAQLSIHPGEQLSMHADYLEAQLKFAKNDREAALQIAKKGLEKAKIFGAIEEKRFDILLQKICFQNPTLPEEDFFSNIKKKSKV